MNTEVSNNACECAPYCDCSTKAATCNCGDDCKCGASCNCADKAPAQSCGCGK